MLWVALYLPRLPLVALTLGTRPTQPVAVIEGAPRTLVLVPDRRAEAVGITAGMTLATALALLPTLRPLPRDRAAEEQVQRWAALRAAQFSPQISVALPDSVLIEVTASLTLFGGLATLVKALVKSVRALGIPVWLAAAPTPRGAWVLARTGTRYNIATLPQLAEVLDPLPTTLLSVRNSQRAEFQSLGLNTLSDLRALPRDGMTRRFGVSLIQEIDRTYGVLPDPQKIFESPTQFSDALTLPVPIADVEMLQFACARLVRALCSFLHLRGLGTTQIAIEFCHEYVPATRIMLGVALTRSEVHLTRVIRERMQRITLVAPAEVIAISGEECAPLTSQQAVLLPGTESAIVVDDVMDRIRARLEADQVFGLSLRGDHRPEFAYRQTEPGLVCNEDCVDAPRPLWLLREPAPIYGTPNESGYALTTGPERIESGWWDGQPMRRDYFIAHSKNGRRCWLYRTDCGQWFMHGLFG